MRQGSTLFLRGVIVLMGLAVLGACAALLAGVVTGRAGEYVPIALGMCVAAVPFFFALYQALKLLGYIDKNEAFSQYSVNAFKKIKYCALVIGGWFAAGMPYVFYVAERDDAPGVVAMGAVIIFASLVIATFAAVLQKLIQSAVDIKSENDLTV